MLSAPHDFLADLNTNQRKAVETADGPTLVIAGPGSGKTRVLTSRVTYLLDVRNIFPYRIMAVTFTNKAAREMKERLTRIVGNKADELMIGTFHSICARILRREAPHAGLDRNFTIYDADDQLNVVKATLAELNLDEKRYKPGSLHTAISNAKNELITPEEFAANTYFNEIAQRVYARYQQILRANNALDFDDLLTETTYLLQGHPAVREKLQERYMQVLVDEFQDTNVAQYTLVKLLAGKHRNLFCVGDPDQSIYKWRGADYRNVLRLREDFKDLNVIPLDQNYRSTQTILDAAMAVIKKNPNRQHINLKTDKGHGPKIVVRELFNEDEEAQYVVDTIAELTAQKAAEPGDVAVMYRTNAQSRAIEDAFVRSGLPYKLVGATRFYARKEIKDVLAYLRIVNNPADSVSLARIVNVPARGIGEKTFAQIDATARANNMSVFDVLSRGTLSGRAAKAITDFAQLWQRWVALRDELSVGQLFDEVVKTSGYRDWLKDGTDEGEDRWANVMELRNVAGEDADKPLSEFLNDVALVSETDNYEENAHAPTLLTLHAAKGLEFRVVFLVGLSDGVLPHSRSLDDAEEMAEERRLMYVGITRAKERLYLLRAFRRSQWGQSDVAEPSRFLADLPNELIDGKRKKNSQIQTEVTTWKSEHVPIQETPRAAGSAFKPGDRVYHAKFGEGMVLRSVRQRDDEEVEVFFESVGGKRLSAAISGLKKI
jgi:DNA helicase-2/ATP-dependent DNA helicase PcrA